MMTKVDLSKIKLHNDLKDISLEPLQKLVDFIVENPRAINMSSWYDSGNICGTTACIAGWLCIQNIPNIEIVKCKNSTIAHLFRLSNTDGYIVKEFANAASDILNLHKDVTKRLFHTDYWDEDLEAEYDVAEENDDHEQMAKIIVRRIVQFLESGE